MFGETPGDFILRALTLSRENAAVPDDFPGSFFDHRHQAIAEFFFDAEDFIKSLAGFFQVLRYSRRNPGHYFRIAEIAVDRFCIISGEIADDEAFGFDLDIHLI